jgi:hypothetical protein
MIEEIILNTERLFNELVIGLKNGEIVVKKAEEVDSISNAKEKNIFFYMKILFGFQILILISQIYFFSKAFFN